MKWALDSYEMGIISILVFIIFFLSSLLFLVLLVDIMQVLKMISEIGMRCHNPWVWRRKEGCGSGVVSIWREKEDGLLLVLLSRWELISVSMRVYKSGGWQCTSMGVYGGNRRQWGWWLVIVGERWDGPWFFLFHICFCNSSLFFFYTLFF